MPPPAAVGGNPGARIAFAIIPAIVCLIGALIAISVSRGRGVTSLGGGPDPHGTSVGAGGVVPSGERLQWDSWNAGSVKVIGDVNGDGVEDFAGRYNVLDMKTSQSLVFVGAFDGKTFQRIWATPSLGTHEQAGQSSLFGVAANQVLVTDFRAKAHAIDARTGKETRVTAMSDRAQFVCSPSDGPSEIWVEVADKKHVLFDMAKGTATVATTKPPWCAARQATSCSDHSFLDNVCEPSSAERSALYKAGISARTVIRRDGPPIFIGQKTPGTAYPLIVAFDPKAGTFAWQQSVAPDPALAQTLSDYPATLAGGRLFTIYKTTSPEEVHVTAFDPASGKRLLDFKVPRGDQGTEPREIVVTAQRIYVPHWTWLDVFDARDGRFLQTVGMW